MGMAIDPATGQQVATPMVQTGYMPVVSYQAYIETHTHTMVDPGEYVGALDSEGKRCG